MVIRHCHRNMRGQRFRNNPFAPQPLLLPTNQGMPARLQTTHTTSRRVRRSRRFLLPAVPAHPASGCMRASGSSRRLSKAQPQANPIPDAAMQPDSCATPSQPQERHALQHDATGRSPAHPHRAVCCCALPCTKQQTCQLNLTGQSKAWPSCLPKERHEPCVWAQTPQPTVMIQVQLNSTVPAPFKHINGDTQKPDLTAKPVAQHTPGTSEFVTPTSEQATSQGGALLAAARAKQGKDRARLPPSPQSC